MRRYFKLLVLGFAMILVGLSPVSAADISVNNTWTNEQIQNAIDIASSGDIFRFAEGVYTGVMLNINKSIKMVAQGTVVLNGTSKKNVLSLNASSISIEGFTIQGGLNGIGSLNQSIENVTIKNNTFRNNTNNGVKIDVQSGNITNNMAYANKWNGIQAAFNKTGLIDENNAYSNERCGIVVTAFNAVVSHNTLTSNGNVKIGIGGGGISATILKNGTILFRDNYIENSTSKNSGNGIYAITSTTGSAQFINNTVLNCGKYGIYADVNGDFIIVNNTVKNTGHNGIVGKGINCNGDGSNGTVDVSGNLVENSSVSGIYMEVSSGNVTNNTVTGSKTGITIGSTGTKVRNNHISNNDVGVLTSQEAGEGNAIEGNVIDGNGVGVQLKSGDVDVKNNNITNSVNSSVKFSEAASNNNVTGNNLINASTAVEFETKYRGKNNHINSNVVRGYSNAVKIPETDSSQGVSDLSSNYWGTNNITSIKNSVTGNYTIYDYLILETIYNSDGSIKTVKFRNNNTGAVDTDLPTTVLVLPNGEVVMVSNGTYESGESPVDPTYPVTEDPIPTEGNSSGDTGNLKDINIPMQKTGMPLIPILFGALLCFAGFKRKF